MLGLLLDTHESVDHWSGQVGKGSKGWMNVLGRYLFIFGSHTVREI
jgi:hypothetical protein